MSNTGYTTRPVGSLSIAELLEEALQAADSAGYYTATDQAYSFWHNEAIQRRNACFEELKRRLEAAEALAAPSQAFLDALDERGYELAELIDSYPREPIVNLIERVCVDEYVRLDAALAPWQEVTDG